MRNLTFDTGGLGSRIFALWTRTWSHPDIGVSATTRFNLFGSLVVATATTLRTAGNPFTFARATPAFAFLALIFHVATSPSLNSGIGKLVQNRRIEIRA